MSTMNSENPLTGTEWFAIGFQAQCALTHAYYCEHSETAPRMTTGAEIGMSSMVARRYIDICDEGYRLTERGRAVLMQGDTMASRALRRAQ